MVIMTLDVPLLEKVARFSFTYSSSQGLKNIWDVLHQLHAQKSIVRPEASLLYFTFVWV
jgi:hypothetical protein